jgi:hypothetical protein
VIFLLNDGTDENKSFRVRYIRAIVISDCNKPLEREGEVSLKQITTTNQFSSQLRVRVRVSEFTINDHNPDFDP